MTDDGKNQVHFDLDAYLRRIEYAGELRPSRAVLESVHAAHAAHIPFENLDILLGRPILLDLGSVQDKLVTGLRGGYCFEQNLLFATALEALGFGVTRLAARVRLGSDVRRARTHMMLIVDVDDARWLADVGFGAAGSPWPVPFGGEQEARPSAWTYRIIAAEGEWLLQSRLDASWSEWLLQSRLDASWSDSYTFTLEPQQAVDYEMANHYTSTYPASPFTQVLIAQQITPEVRRVLRNREYSEERGPAIVRRMLADDDEVLELLDEKFGLRFPAGTRFAYRDVTS